MVINLILALTIPISLTIMGFFYYKTFLLFLKNNDEQKIEPPSVEEEEKESKLNTEEINNILNDYLNGGV